MIRDYKKFSPIIGEESWIADNAAVIGRVEIGSDVSIWFGAVVRGDVHFIKIGDKTNIQDLSVLHVTHRDPELNNNGFPLVIGEGVTVGHKVMLHGCTVHDYCLIGMNAVILDGAEIGKESIVGAGALVTKGKKFPPRSLIMGSPAKVIRTLTNKEVDSLYNSAKRYVSYKNDYLDQ